MAGFMKTLIVTIFFYSLYGCILVPLIPIMMTANGDKFVQLEEPKIDKAAVYIFRQLKLGGSAYCQPISIDGARIPCLKNGGYIRVELPQGEHVIGFPKRALEAGKGLEKKVRIEGGSFLFLEWATALRDVILIGSQGSVTMTETIYEHDKKAALLILSELKES